MDDTLEAAKSGRAGCRGCQQKIAKGEPRFGESVENPYGDGDTYHWFHPHCAAHRRPEKFLAVLEASELEVEDRDDLIEIATWGAENPELARVRRVEPAPTGRARCRECKEMIAKAALRVVVETEPDPLAMVATYFIHLQCAGDHVGPVCLGEKLAAVSGDLDDAQRAEVAERWPHE